MNSSSESQISYFPGFFVPRFNLDIKIMGEYMTRK